MGFEFAGHSTVLLKIFYLYFTQCPNWIVRLVYLINLWIIRN